MKVSNIEDHRTIDIDAKCPTEYDEDSGTNRKLYGQINSLIEHLIDHFDSQILDCRSACD